MFREIDQNIGIVEHLEPCKNVPRESDKRPPLLQLCSLALHTLLIASLTRACGPHLRYMQVCGSQKHVKIECIGSKHVFR